MLRGLRLIALTLVLLVTAGCVRAEGDLTLDGDSDTASGSIAFAVAYDPEEESEESRAEAADLVLRIVDTSLPGLREHAEVTSAPLEQSGWLGTTLTLDEVPISDLVVAGGEPLITRDGEEFVVAGTINALDAEGIPAAPAVEEDSEDDVPPRRAGATDSLVRLTVTFPGPVDEVGEVTGEHSSVLVEGNTVTWQAPYDEPLTLEAEGAAFTPLFSADVWRLVWWGLGILAVLAVAGLVTVLVRGRRD
ncbi:LppM family (lipo)protein [Serinibacter salmoneus]|uniref:LppM domain-containing protein n=1 Tax=Serinibacter salmoneus TaxID=556530 RepID=A0A2A9D4E6_9MICO|nr:hypothetical protein [Serinibacter salmoneus]PFG20832.1 hypothetical protein ATL40_2447 [Serinibacter salmoneus]